MNFKPGDKVRPSIEEYFPNLEQAHSAYLSAPELFQYAQALDNYIDDLEPIPASKADTVGEEWETLINKAVSEELEKDWWFQEVDFRNGANWAKSYFESTISQLRAELEQLKKVK